MWLHLIVNLEILVNPNIYSEENRFSVHLSLLTKDGTGFASRIIIIIIKKRFVSSIVSVRSIK